MHVWPLWFEVAADKELHVGKTAFLFPGQGSQKVGMGQALFETHAVAKETFEEADAALGEKLSTLMFEGPDEELKKTANTQPAILTHSVAVHRVLMSLGVPPPDYVAGHSLGEYSALVAAGTLDFADAVRAVRKRGAFMQEAVPLGVGAMAAVMGLDASVIAGICDEISEPDADAYVAVANFNGPAQTVIAGHQAGVEKATAVLKEKGARRVLPLPVSAPFHSALMAPVGTRLQGVLAGIQFEDPAIPLVANVTADTVSEADTIRDLLVQQVDHPVRFTEMGERLFALGVDRFVEVGPGKALIGMLKRMSKDRTYLNADDAETANNVKGEIAP
jgi:[acyl-carrier-protein] S-malonyltransferase